MNFINYKLLTALSMQFLGLMAYAQITVGTPEPLTLEELLQAKQTDFITTTGDEANAGKGFLLPQLHLTSRDSLVPTLILDQENAAEAKERHAGLIIFNMNAIPHSDPDLVLEQGIYVWDGTEWIPIRNIAETEN